MRTGLLILEDSTNKGSETVDCKSSVVTASVAELAELAANIVARGGTAVLESRGGSMKPMLRARKSLVRLSAPDSLAVGDVLFYRYPNGKCVLHRLIQIPEDGSLLCRGDNNARTERIQRDWVIAKAVAFSRSRRWVSCDNRLYRLYWKSCLLLWPLRRMLRLAVRLLRLVHGKNDGSV